MTHVRLFAVLALSALLCVVSMGCESTEEQEKGITSESLRKDLSPEMYGLNFTREQDKNHNARVSDLNVRQIPDDAKALLLLDRPQRMSIYVIP